MRTNVWVAVLWMVSGCTSNGIFLETVTGGDTGETGDETETSPPSDSSSDDGPPPECTSDSECGDCGWCDQGVCQEDVGCCAAQPDTPWVWHCQPPWDCYEDEECDEGMVCNSGFCEPDPNPEILEPPACRGDLALQVQQLPVEVPIVQIAAIEGRGLQGIEESLGLVELDLVAGVGSPPFELFGDEAVDFIAAGVATGMAITQGSSPDGLPIHQLTLTIGGGDAWSIDTGPEVPGSVRAAAWLGAGTSEVVTAIDDRLDRWSVGPDVTLMGAHALGVEVHTVAGAQPFGADAPMIAAVLADGTPWLVDGSTGEVVASGDPLRGQPIDLADHGAELFALSHVPADPEAARPDMAAVHVLQVDGSISATAPFGAPGVPLALAMVELDGNGVDDVLVANADGRVDIYLMQPEGPLCRSYLQLAPILDFETGDVDDDGRIDSIASDQGPVVTVIHGVAAP
jgi:hypothetical protein